MYNVSNMTITYRSRKKLWCERRGVCKLTSNSCSHKIEIKKKKSLHFTHSPNIVVVLKLIHYQFIISLYTQSGVMNVLILQ